MTLLHDASENDDVPRSAAKFRRQQSRPRRSPRRHRSPTARSPNMVRHHRGSGSGPRRCRVHSEPGDGQAGCPPDRICDVGCPAPARPERPNRLDPGSSSSSVTPSPLSASAPMVPACNVEPMPAARCSSADVTHVGTRCQSRCDVRVRQNSGVDDRDDETRRFHPPEPLHS